MSAIQKVKKSFKIDNKLIDTAYAILNEPDVDKACDLLDDYGRKETKLIFICLNAIRHDVEDYLNSRL